MVCNLKRIDFVRLSLGAVMDTGIERVRHAVSFALACADRQQMGSDAEIAEHTVERVSPLLVNEVRRSVRTLITYILTSDDVMAAIDVLRLTGAARELFPFVTSTGELTDIFTALEAVKLDERSGTPNPLRHSVLAVKELTRPVNEEAAWEVFYHDVGKLMVPISFDEDGSRHFKRHPVRGAEWLRETALQFGFDTSAADRMAWIVSRHEVLFNLETCDPEMKNSILGSSPSKFWALMKLHVADNNGRDVPKNEIRVDDWVAARKRYWERRHKRFLQATLRVPSATESVA